MFSGHGSRDSFDSLLSPITSNANATRSDSFFSRRGSSHSPRPTQHRRMSTASSIHSIGGSLDTSSSHSLFETGQNAISTLLQPPIVRTGLLPHTHAPASAAHKPPTARDIPPVALTNIPHVDASEFKAYLSEVAPLFDHLRRVKESEDDTAGVLNRRGSRVDEQLEDDGHLRPGKRPANRVRKGSSASINSISSLEAPSPVRRTSSGFNGRRSIAHGPPPLTTIPNVYFEEDFHLENPRTFDVVSERSEVVRPTPGATDEKTSNGTAAAPRKALATNAILQEKLSWYMDTIEMHLIQSISTASTTFFTALGSLRELHSEAAESVDRIKALRKELEALDEEIATSGLTIIEERRRRENLEQLHDAVLQLKEVVRSASACEELVDAGEVEKALDSIDALEKLIAGEAGAVQESARQIHLRDLRGTVALQGVSEDIDFLRLRVGKAYEAKFIDILMGDIRRHTDQVSSQEVLMRWTSASMRARGGHGREPSAFPSYMTAVDELRAQLGPILRGLQRANHLSAATAVFRESVLRQIRSVIRQPLPSSNDDDNTSIMSSSTTTGGARLSQQQKSTILARNLRALDPQDVEELLVKIYIGVTETLRRLTTQAKVILDVASSIGEDGSLPAGMKSPQLKSPPFSPTRGGSHEPPSMASIEAQEEIHRTLDLTNLVGQAVDVAQDKIVKLLKVRTEQSTHLGLVWFLRYFTLNLHFANECESISGRSGSTLKTVVNGQIKDFVQRHGDKEKQRLAQEMESDQWGAKDFGEEDQKLLDEILDSSTKDAPSWAEGTEIWTPYSDVDEEANGTSETVAQTNGTTKAKIRGAVIDGENTLLPNSAILCMHGMAHFLHLIVGIPSIAADVSASLISYLQLFNSRCTQLILGAGATKSAGLRNITTKHLAIASQALGFIAALVPYIREFVRRHSGSGAAVTSVMGEFDKVRRLYQEHQNSIYDKLVEIMGGRALAAAKKMKAIDWDSSGDAVHDYMEIITKETTTLHRNLAKHLPEGTLRFIMLQVFESYKNTFGTALKTAEPRTEGGRNSMMKDVDYFETRLGKLDGFEDAAEHLRGLVKSKEVKAPAPPREPPAPPPPSKDEEPEKPKVSDDKPEVQEPVQQKSDEEKPVTRSSEEARPEEEPEALLVEGEEKLKESKAETETELEKEKESNADSVNAGTEEPAKAEP